MNGNKKLTLKSKGVDLSGLLGEVLNRFYVHPRQDVVDAVYDDLENNHPDATWDVILETPKGRSAAQMRQSARAKGYRLLPERALPLLRNLPPRELSSDLVVVPRKGERSFCLSENALLMLPDMVVPEEATWAFVERTKLAA